MLKEWIYIFLIILLCKKADKQDNLVESNNVNFILVFPHLFVIISVGCSFTLLTGYSWDHGISYDFPKTHIIFNVFGQDSLSIYSYDLNQYFKSINRWSCVQFYFFIVYLLSKHFAKGTRIQNTMIKRINKHFQIIYFKSWIQFLKEILFLLSSNSLSNWRLWCRVYNPWY